LFATTIPLNLDSTDIPVRQKCHFPDRLIKCDKSHNPTTSPLLPPETADRLVFLLKE
jgi:hypothetical protein